MIPPLKAIRRVLLGNVYLDGQNIPVIQRDYPYDHTPCITVDDSGGSRFIQRYITTQWYPVPKNHPQFNVEDPFHRLPQQCIREKYDTSININVWCDTGKDLEHINKQVQRLFYEAQSDHYQFCDNYREGECAYMDNTCYAKHFLNYRSAKHQCPNPEVYGYKNIFKRFNLIRSSFHLDPPFTINDRSKDQMIYHSVLKLHTAYYTDHIIGGIVPNTIKEDTVIL